MAYVVLGAALTVGSLRVVPFSLGWRDALFGAFLLAAAAVGSSVRVRINEYVLLSAPSTVFVVVAAVLLGPVAAAVVGGVAGACLIPSPRPATTFYIGLGTLEGAAAGLAAHAVLPGAAWTGLGRLGRCRGLRGRDVDRRPGASCIASGGCRGARS